MPPVCFDHPPQDIHTSRIWLVPICSFFPMLHCYHFSYNDRWRFLISTSGGFWSSASSNLSILLHLFFALTTLVLSLWWITLSWYSQNGWSQYCATSQPTFYRSSKINPIKQLAPCFALWDRTSIKNPLYLMRNTSDPGAQHVQRPSLEKSFKTNFSKTPTSSPLQPGCICLQAHHAVLSPAPSGWQTWRPRFYFLSLKLSQSHLAHPHLSLGDRARRRGSSPIYIFQFVFFFNLKLWLILF